MGQGEARSSVSRAALRDRLPASEDLRLVFGWCAFLIHAWALFNLLDVLPSWILRLGIYELAGTIAYPLAFALLESLLVWAIVTLAAVLLPANWLKVNFAVQASLLVLITALWSVVIHINYEAFLQYRKYFVAFASIYLLTLLLPHLLIQRYSKAKRGKKFMAAMRSVLQRIEVLSFLYIFFDILGVLIILIRNF
ncbi:MAG: hypothetical protein AB1894_11380 [Chloroflexota bacterium]